MAVQQAASAATVGSWRRAAAIAIDSSSLDASPSLEADVLLGHVLGVERAWLYAHADDLVDHDAAVGADALLERRLVGEPIAYLLGWKEFRSRRFAVTPDVLIPRDDTEVLVDVGLQLARELYVCLARPLTIVDAGTGSGIVAITLALELDVPAVVIGLDRSESALRVAAGNAVVLGADVRFVASDWLSALGNGSVALVVSNPPYVAVGDRHLEALMHEPLAALVAGHDGQDDIRVLTREGSRVLSRPGALAMEHGADQGRTTTQVLDRAGYTRTLTVQDESGLDRVSSGRRGAGAAQGIFTS